MMIMVVIMTMVPVMMMVVMIFRQMKMFLLFSRPAQDDLAILSATSAGITHNFSFWFLCHKLNTSRLQV